MRLQIIPLPLPDMVPRGLLEQVKDREWQVDEWYKLQKQMIGNKENLILGLVDENLKVRGICWLTIDGFSKWIFINTLSMEPGVIKGKKLIKILSRYIKDLGKTLGLKRVIWAARRYKAIEKYGFEQSEYKLMEGKIGV